MSEDEELITADEIAHYINVRVSAVANWRARHEDFPESRSQGGREHYPLERLLAWLDGRRIPRNRLAEGELPGATYGSRLRRGLGREAPPQPAAVNPQEWVERLWCEAERLWEGADPKALAHLLLNTFREIDDPLSYPDDEFGEMLDRFMEGYAAKDERGLWRADLYAAIQQRGGILDDPKASRVSTPPSLARLLAKLTVNQMTMEVLDPCVDSANIALEVARVSDASDPERPCFTGIAPTRFLTDEVGQVLMRIEEERFTVTHEEFPTKLLRYGHGPGRYDTILANPPFNARTPVGIPEQYWPFGVPAEGNANFAWIQVIWSALAMGGRAAIVQPVSSLSAGGRERQIRAALLEWGAVNAVITLPAKLFAATAVPVAVWLLSKQERIEQSDVLMIDASNLGRAVSRTQHELTDEDIDRIDLAVSGWLVDIPAYQTGFVGSIPLSEIEAADWLLLPGVYIGDSTESPLSEAGPGVLRAELDRLGDDLETNEARILDGFRDASKPIAGERTTTHLREICFIKSGPSGRLLTLVPSSPETVPVVTPRDLAGSRIAQRPAGAVSQETAMQAKAYRVRPGDLLFSRVGDLGRVAVVAPEHSGWLMGSGCFLLRVESDDVDPGYLAHYLRRSSVQEWIKRNNSGSAVATLNPTVLGMLTVEVPSWAEQRRVAGILGSLDEKAAVYRRLAATTAALRDEISVALFEPEPDVPAKYVPVIRVLERLPRGRWVSYGDLAAVADSGAQTIGTVLREAAYVPNAHRVLRSNGKVSPEWETNDGLLTAADVPGLLIADGVPVDEKDEAAPEARMTVEELRGLLSG